jgi:hypothetical protein
MTDKLCIECKHYREYGGDQGALYCRCANPRLAVASPVLGNIPATRPASEIRDDVNRCGKEGQWFEPTT